ncbi:Rho termination factor N-terminal domain-containing protein [Staphylococcus lutrae]|uniref:Rho termination factor N-terminal domain-containing protein n=1 Tax=Staphylococcus lutrae TaxID=155085 RepID=A0AAC9WIW6_9STAP|nr:Rho termination factor N-terminal domain-containing protein [Staphylococcus lutrae]ARJ50565.1 hypothetical protein B5P37_04165 [Staphylococcus lutrae]PNZ37494.1 hypothetical protein CD134_06070 [Staphylococcus lutrae]
MTYKDDEIENGSMDFPLEWTDFSFDQSEVFSETSIVTLMNNYKIKDIKALCKKHGIKGYSSMNKAEMLEHFILELVTPEYIYEEMMKMSDLQKLLLFIAADIDLIQRGVITAIEVPDTFLMFKRRLSPDPEAEVEVIVPDEIVDLVLNVIQKNSAFRKIAEAYRMVTASANLYGVLTLKQLQVIYETYLGEQMQLIKIEKWLNDIHLVNPDFKAYRVVNGLIVSTGIQLEDMELVDYISHAIYYMPKTKAELLAYEDTFFGIEEALQYELMDWFLSHIDDSRVLGLHVSQFVTEVLLLLKHLPDKNVITPIIQDFVEQGFLKKSQEQKVIEKFEAVYQTMPNWFYHGYTYDAYQKLGQKDNKGVNNVIDFYQYLQNKK